MVFQKEEKTPGIQDSVNQEINTLKLEIHAIKNSCLFQHFAEQKLKNTASFQSYLYFSSWEMPLQVKIISGGSSA